MGKSRIIFCTAVCIFLMMLCSCGNNSQKASESTQAAVSASEEEFIKDVKEALEKRAEVSKGYGPDVESKLSMDEKIETWTGFVEPEKAMIEKYKDVQFSNDKFDKIAEMYLDGVNGQVNALHYLPDYEGVFNISWQAGYLQRAAAIKELCDYYGLEISQELYDEYFAALNSAYNGQITADADNAAESGKVFDKDPIEVTGMELISGDSDHFSANAKIKNISGQNLKNVVVNLNLLNSSGDIVEQRFFFNDGILQNEQSANVSVYLEKNFDKIAVRSYQFYDSDGKDYQLDPKEPVEFTVKDILKAEKSTEGTTAAKKETATTEEQKSTEKTKKETGSTPKKEADEAIKDYIETHVIRNYDDTRIDSITINDDLGTDKEGDYVALVNLTWKVKNGSEMTEKMLQMYSDDLAASLAKEQPNVQEVAIFWKVPYHGENTSKWSYERRGEGMYQTDKMLGF